MKKYVWMISLPFLYLGCQSINREPASAVLKGRQTYNQEIAKKFKSHLTDSAGQPLSADQFDENYFNYQSWRSGLQPIHFDKNALVNLSKKDIYFKYNATESKTGGLALWLINTSASEKNKTYRTHIKADIECSRNFKFGTEEVQAMQTYSFIWYDSEKNKNRSIISLTDPNTTCILNIGRKQVVKIVPYNLNLFFTDDFEKCKANKFTLARSDNPISSCDRSYDEVAVLGNEKETAYEKLKLLIRDEKKARQLIFNPELSLTIHEEDLKELNLIVVSYLDVRNEIYRNHIFKAFELYAKKRTPIFVITTKLFLNDAEKITLSELSQSNIQFYFKDYSYLAKTKFDFRGKNSHRLIDQHASLFTVVHQNESSTILENFKSFKNTGFRISSKEFQKDILRFYFSYWNQDIETLFIKNPYLYDASLKKSNFSSEENIVRSFFSISTGSVGSEKEPTYSKLAGLIKSKLTLILHGSDLNSQALTFIKGLLQKNIQVELVTASISVPMLNSLQQLHSTFFKLHLVKDTNFEFSSHTLFIDNDYQYVGGIFLNKGDSVAETELAFLMRPVDHKNTDLFKLYNKLNFAKK